MATYRAIAAAGATLTGLIRDRYPRTEFGPALDVQLYQTSNFVQPMSQGFSVFLFRVAINGSVRNMTYRRSPDGRRFRPSLPVDLYYMITAWAEDSERQQRMLGWAMRMLEDVGQLSASHLNHYIAESDTFAPTESVDIICDPLSLSDYFTIWDRLRTLPPSVTYVLRMVLIDSDVSVDEGPLVQKRNFDMGEVVA
jgi:hypothetical protein